MGLVNARFSLGVLDVGVLHNTLEIAPRLEEIGYSRYWVSEHHGEGYIPTPAIAATLLIGMTSTIRIGVAGVLLRYQSPLAVAQTYRTLQWLSNGRVDLGVARGISHRPQLEAALLDGRADLTPEGFGDKVRSVQALVTGRVPPEHPMFGGPVEPSLDPELGPPPLWVLANSKGAGIFAAKNGLNLSYHNYYGKDGAESIKAYVGEFKPSPELAAPYWNVCIDAFVAETEAEARSRRVIPGTRDDSKERPNDFFVGTPAQFEDYLGGISQKYQTRNIILSSLRGPHDVNRQFESYERAMQCAKKLWA